MSFFVRSSSVTLVLPPYYPAVPVVVGTTGNSDMTGLEASGGCRGKGGWVVFVIFVHASVIYCNLYVAQPQIFNIPGVAAAVLQTALWLFDRFIESSFSSQSSKHHTSQTERARELKLWESDNSPPGVRRHVSGVRCQVSGVMFQVSGVKCQVSGVTCHFFFKIYIYIFFN